MEYGLIKDTTVKAIADGLRAKKIVSEHKFIWVDTVHYKSDSATSLTDPTPISDVSSTTTVSVPGAVKFEIVLNIAHVGPATSGQVDIKDTTGITVFNHNIYDATNGPGTFTHIYEKGDTFLLDVINYGNIGCKVAAIMAVTAYGADGNIIPVYIETDETNTITPAEMVEAINDFQILDQEVYQSILDRTIERVEAKYFGDITRAGSYAFANCKALTEVEFPDTIEAFGDYVFDHDTKLNSVIIPKNIKSLAVGVFNGTSMLKTLTFYRTPPKIVENTFTGININTIYVPGEGYDDYLAAPYWGTTYRDLLKVNSKYAGKPSNKILVFGETSSVSIPLTNYDSSPTDVHVTSDNACVSINNIVASTTEVTFDIRAGQTEDIANITIEIPGDNGHTFVRTMQAAVYAELTPSTYEVIPVEGASYGFELTDDGFYKSTNQKVANSAAVCRVNISNMMGLKMYVDGISYGESNYDYGFLSNINTELSTTAKLDTTGVYFTYKGLSSPNVRPTEYTGAIGDCFIYIKFIKDGSGDSFDDSFKFKIRFEGEAQI